jgi:hypothetical protein
MSTISIVRRKSPESRRNQEDKNRADTIRGKASPSPGRIDMGIINPFRL